MNYFDYHRTQKCDQIQVDIEFYYIRIFIFLSITKAEFIQFICMKSDKY